MPSSPNLSFAFGLEPKEAVAYFERLGYKVTDDWIETAEAVRGKAFAVAKSGSLDVLKDIKGGLIESAKSGETEASFIARVGGILQAKGWEPNSPSRLKTIFRTNMQSAYMAGRWEQFQASKKSRPYLQYVAVMDAVTRPSHAAMNGLVFHIDDPIWKTHYPPCGYNCRCRVRSHSAASLKAQKLQVLDSAGDTFTETVDVGKGRKAEVFGYRTPLRPTRVALKDSAPGEYPKVERGKALWWDPAFDPKWADGEGPDWKIKTRRDAMRTDPGFGFNQGRWDDFDRPSGVDSIATGAGSLVAATADAAKVAREIPGQSTWADIGRPDLRDVVDRRKAPPLLPRAESKDEALELLATTVGVSITAPFRVVRTPVPEIVRIDYEKLEHLVDKRNDARERYGLFLLDTLAAPYEVYLTAYDDGTFRTRYIGLYDGPKQLLVVGLVNRDGTLLWNIMQSNAKRLNEQRVGTLLYVRPEGEEK